MKTLKITVPILLFASLPANVCGGYATFEIDVTGWQTWGALGSANNSSTTIDIRDVLDYGGDHITITGIGWDLEIATVGSSWQSEVAFDISNSAGDSGVVVTPGFDAGSPGTGSFSSGGIIKLADANIDDIFLEDSIFTMEAFETFDDPNNTDTGQVQDSNISGTILIQTNLIPAPASVAILFAAAGLNSRRRRR